MKLDNMDNFKIELKSPNNQEPMNPWVRLIKTIGWICFVLLCFTYCCRAEIVELLK